MSKFSEINELKQERASVIKEAREVLDEARENDRLVDGDLGSEDQEKYDRLMEREESLRKQFEREEDLLAKERDLEARGERIAAGAEPNVDPEFRDLPVEEIEERENRAFTNWFKEQATGQRHMDEDDRKFLYRARDPEQNSYGGGAPYRNLRRQDREARAGQQSSTAGSGGQFIPEGFAREIVEAQKAFGGLEGISRVRNTDSGNDLPVPTVDDTANTGSLVGEASTIGGTTHVATSNVVLKAWKYQSGPIKASMEIIQDSAFDMGEFLREQLGTRMGRIFAQHIVTRSSTETTGPEGIVNASTGATSFAQGSTTLTPAVFRTLRSKVDPAYRGNERFLLNDESWHNALSVTDGDGRALIQPSLLAGRPDLVIGVPVTIDQNVPSMSSTETSPTKPLWYGDFSRFNVRRVRAMSIFRFNERYLHEGNFAWIAFMRADGRAVLGTTDPARKAIRCAVTTT